MPGFGFCYDAPGSRCSSHAYPGTLALQGAILRRWPRLYDLGTYVCRANSGGAGLSVHAVGRAGDTGVPAAAKAHGDELALWLVAVAELLGVQRVIWYRRIWDSVRREWHVYSGSSPHTDHVHWELCTAAATQLTAAMIDPLLSIGKVRGSDMFLCHPDDRATVYICDIGSDGKVKGLPIEDPADRDAFLKSGVPLVEVKAATWKGWGGV